jgi:membrane-bound ClpP family serine protease
LNKTKSITFKKSFFLVILLKRRFKKMIDCCTPRCIATKLLIFGIILILVRLFTGWDIWVVIGVLLIIKAILMYIIPVCPCNSKSGKKK